MKFSDIPVRDNNQDVLAEWFNYLRLCGITIESLFGVGDIAETPFTIANNQVAASNITGLLFNPISIGGFVVDYRIYRNTTGAGSTELSESGILIGTFSPVAGTWAMTQSRVGDSGVVFPDPLPSGQLQYTSSNITGTPDVSKITFKARTIAI